MNGNRLKTVASRSLLALALGASAVGAAHAAQCALIPTGVAEMDDTERVQLLQQFKFAELDDLLAKRARKQLSMPGGDLLTLRDLANLQSMSGSNENLARMWVDARPQSFFAQYNAGLLYGMKAFHARGSDASSTVTAAQMREVKKQSEVALGYFQKAIALDPKSAVPYASLMGLAAIQGGIGGRDTQQWFEAANQANPKNMTARIQAINFLTPRYGIPYELLDQMVAQSEKVLPALDANYLKYNLVLEKGNHYEVIERRKPQAQTLYKQALAMCENSETARAGIVRTY